MDEGDALQEVVDFATFFTYLEETIMPNVFPDAWYNDAGGEPVVLWRGISQNKDVSRGEPKVALPDMCSVF